MLSVYRWYLKFGEKSNVREFMKEKREKSSSTEDTPIFKDERHEEPAKVIEKECTRQEEN